MVFLILLEATYFTFAFVPSEIAGDSFLVSIQSHDPDDFSGFGVLSILPPPSFMEVMGSPINRIQFSNGDWSGFVRVFRAADSLHLNCTEYGHNDENLSNRFSVIPNDPRRLQILLPGEQSDPGNIVEKGRFQDPFDIVAINSTTASVYITDEWWNPVGQGSEEVYLRSNNPFPVLPLPQSTVSGYLQVQYQLRTARGANRLYLHRNPGGADTLISDTSSAFTVIPGDFVRLLLIVPGETLLPGDTLKQPTSMRYPGTSGGPLPQSVGRSFTTSVFAMDDCWNMVNTAPSDSVRVGVGFPNIQQVGMLNNGMVNIDITPDRGGFILPLKAEDVSNPTIEESYYVHVEIQGSYYPPGEDSIGNYPNPFGSEHEFTTIQYYLREDADVSIKVYDKFGNLVWSRRENGQGGEGGNQVIWYGIDNDDEYVDSGIYFLYLQATNRTETIAKYKRKIAVIR
jgi:hypothetical protein